MQNRLLFGAIALVALTGPIITPVFANAATRPTVSIKASSKSVASKGGTIQLKITVHGASMCVFTSTPAISGFAGRTKCSNVTLKRSAKLGKKTGAARTIRFKVTAENGKSSSSAQATVKQAGTSKSVSTPTPAPTSTTTPVTPTTPVPVTTTTAAPNTAATTTSLSINFAANGPGSGVFTTTATVSGNGQTVTPAAGQVSVTFLDTVSGQTIGTYSVPAGTPSVCTFNIAEGLVDYTVTPTAPDLCSGPTSEIPTADANLFGFYVDASYAGTTGHNASTSASQRV